MKGRMVHWDPPLETIFLLLLIFLQINSNVVGKWLQTTEEPAVEVCRLFVAPVSPTAGRILGKNISVILECT